MDNYSYIIHVSDAIEQLLYDHLINNGYTQLFQIINSTFKIEKHKKVVGNKIIQRFSPCNCTSYPDNIQKDINTITKTSFITNSPPYLIAHKYFDHKYKVF